MARKQPPPRKTKFKIVFGVEGHTERNYFTCLKRLKRINWEIEPPENDMAQNIPKIISRYNAKPNIEVDLICLIYDLDNNSEEVLRQSFNILTTQSGKFRKAEKRFVPINGRKVEIALFLNKFEFETFLLHHFDDCCHKNFNTKDDVIARLKPHLNNCRNIKIADQGEFENKIFHFLSDKIDIAIENSINCAGSNLTSDCGHMLRYVQHFKPIE